MIKTAARTNNPNARKFYTRGSTQLFSVNAVPVLVSTLVSELDRTEVAILGIELSMLATTTSPTIIVTAALVPT
jgi:hypothetical protein